ARASGAPVVLPDDPALREVAGEAGLYGDPAEAVRRVLADRERYRHAGLERAKLFTWARSAELRAEPDGRVIGGSSPQSSSRTATRVRWRSRCRRSARRSTSWS